MATVRTDRNATTRSTSSTDETRRARRIATAAFVVALAPVAVALGTVAGSRLAGPPTVLPPPQPTGVVTYPDDWQQYRAGERTAHELSHEPRRGIGVGRGVAGLRGSGRG